MINLDPTLMEIRFQQQRQSTERMQYNQSLFLLPLIFTASPLPSTQFLPHRTHLLDFLRLPALGSFCLEHPYPFSIPGKIQCIFHWMSFFSPQDAFLTVGIILITASSGFLIHLVLILFLKPSHSNYLYLWVPGIGTVLCSSCYSLQCLEWGLVHR